MKKNVVVVGKNGQLSLPLNKHITADPWCFRSILPEILRSLRSLRMTLVDGIIRVAAENTVLAATYRYFASYPGFLSLVSSL